LFPMTSPPLHPTAMHTRAHNARSWNKGNRFNCQHTSCSKQDRDHASGGAEEGGGGRKGSRALCQQHSRGRKVRGTQRSHRPPARNRRGAALVSARRVALLPVQPGGSFMGSNALWKGQQRQAGIVAGEVAVCSSLPCAPLRQEQTSRAPHLPTRRVTVGILSIFVLENSLKLVAFGPHYYLQHW